MLRKENSVQILVLNDIRGIIPNLNHENNHGVLSVKKIRFEYERKINKCYHLSSAKQASIISGIQFISCSHTQSNFSPIPEVENTFKIFRNQALLAGTKLRVDASRHIKE